MSNSPTNSCVDNLHSFCVSVKLVTAASEESEIDDKITLPNDLDFSLMGKSLPRSVIDELNLNKPKTVAAFRKIRGVTNSSAKLLISLISSRNIN